MQAPQSATCPSLLRGSILQRITPWANNAPLTPRVLGCRSGLPLASRWHQRQCVELRRVGLRSCLGCARWKTRIHPGDYGIIETNLALVKEQCVTLLLLIRHGVNDWVHGRLAGWTPGVQLNAAGKGQALALSERLGDLPISAIYT
ncbi:MAG: histidine phosphatase family protein, partial [Chloroflexales bacterium]